MSKLYEIGPHAGEAEKLIQVVNFESFPEDTPQAWAIKQRLELWDMMEEVGIRPWDEDTLDDQLNDAQKDPESLLAAVARVVGCLWLVEFAPPNELPWLMLELGRADCALKTHKLMPALDTGVKIRKSLCERRDQYNAKQKEPGIRRKAIIKRIMLETGETKSPRLTGMIKKAQAEEDLSIGDSQFYKELAEVRAEITS